MYPVFCPAASAKTITKHTKLFIWGRWEAPCAKFCSSSEVSVGWADPPAWAEGFLSFGFAGGLLDPSHIPISQLGGVRELRATGTGNLCAPGDGATHTLCQNHTPHSARQGMAKLCSIFLLPETIAWPSWWLVQSSQGLKPYFNICLPFAGLFFFFFKLLLDIWEPDLCGR